MKPGALIGKKYRLTRKIGEGAMGVVWAATHEQTSREFALKFILRSTKDLRARLLREARAAGGIEHPNVIEIHDVGETDEGEPFLVMPLLTGETLCELLGRTRRLEPQHAARIGRDVARALAAAHGKQIIHRDLKPANIFLQQVADAEEPVVKVLDFGVSKNLESSEGLNTVTGATVGSPAYMSPEQADADRGMDHRADLWSLGVVLFEMLTGVRPFQGDTNQIIIQITTTEAPRLSRFLRHVDPALTDLVGRCLERDRNKRIGAAADLAQELQRFIAAGPGKGGNPPASLGRAPNSSRPTIDVLPPGPCADDDDKRDTARMNVGRSPARAAGVPSSTTFGPESPPPPSEAHLQRYPVTTPLRAFAQPQGPIGGAPRTAPQLRQLPETIPLRPTAPEDATRLPQGTMMVEQGSPARAGVEASVGPPKAGAVRSPTSSTGALVKASGLDGALVSSAGAMAQPKRLALVSVVIGLSVIGLGLIGVVLYTILFPPSPPAGASVEAAKPSEVIAPAATPSTTATATATVVPTAPAPATPSPLPVLTASTTKPSVPAPRRAAAAPSAPRAASGSNLPEWLRESVQKSNATRR